MEDAGVSARAATQAGIWADDTVRTDTWRAGAALLVIAVIATWLFGPSDEVEQAQQGGIGLAFGGAAAVLSWLVLVWRGRRLPDWAVGIGDEAAPAPLLRAPLLNLGWALTAIAALGALLVAGLGQAIAAAAIGAVSPLAMAYSLNGFLERARRTQAWAAGRGLAWHPEHEVPEGTPLLREGDYRYATNAIEGRILGDRKASLMHLACVEIDETHDGGSDTTRRFTVLVTAVADPGRKLPLCICAPRSRVPGYNKLEALLSDHRRITMESSEFERRFELAIDKRGDEVWLHQLFTPAFIEQLTLLDPGRLGWELEAGRLCVYEQGYVTSAAELDRLVELSRLVADRIGEEVGQISAA